MIDFGGKLRQAREGRGLSLRQIAVTTKISVAALEALERNDVSKLPGGIFSRAFVKSYATEVGLDPEQTVKDFLTRFGLEPPPDLVQHVPASEQESAFEQRQRAVALGAKAISGVLIVGAVAAFFVWKGRQPPAPATTEAPPVPPAAASTTSAPAAPASAVTPTKPPAPAAASPDATTMRLEVHPTAACWVKLV